MTNDGAPPRQRALAPEVSDTLDVPGGLRRLAADYPAFRFRTRPGHDRTRLRWVAERIRGMDAGLHTVITTDFDELRAALDADARRSWPGRLTREQALRALL